MCCRPSRIFDVGSSIRAPGRSPEPRSRKLGLLGVLQPSGSSAPAARPEHPADLRSPGAGSSASWVCCRPSRIFDVGSSIRAPGRSPEPRSRKLGLLGVLQPSGSLTSAKWPRSPRRPHRRSRAARRRNTPPHRRSPHGSRRRPPCGLFCFPPVLPRGGQRQEHNEQGAADVDPRVFVYSSIGGAEGSRTPVRK